jgi:hypothetical protein
MWAYIILLYKRPTIEGEFEMSNHNSQMPPTPPHIQHDYVLKKKEFEGAFKEFHKNVFSSKVLDKNKTAAVKKTEKHIVDRLVKAAVSLDTVNQGEGLLALCTVMVRELLTSRDRMNDLEYEMCLQKKELASLKQELGVTDEKKRKA